VKEGARQGEVPKVTNAVLDLLVAREALFITIHAPHMGVEETAGFGSPVLICLLEADFGHRIPDYFLGGQDAKLHLPQSGVWRS